jgi:hypothetical protein
VLWAWLAAVGSACAADYSFDLAEIDAKPYEISGYVQAKAEHFALRPAAALFPLSYAGRPPRHTLDRASADFELAGKATQGMALAYARIGGSASRDAYQASETGMVMEAGLRLSPSEGLVVDLGKQVQRWGKGYAWNPVAFFERPKDPNDPAASRAGYVMASADFVKSLPGGPVAAIGFTPLLLPVTAELNTSYGASHHANPGARLYLLVADTDIDLLWAAEGTRPQRVGLDFSRNLGTQWEVHGEWARAIGATRRVLQAEGSLITTRVNVDSALLGARYISDNEVTWVVELYRNGAGYDASDLSRYYGALQAAYAPSGTAAAQAQMASLAASGYGRANPGRRYAYLRVSTKDPFDWLYVNPALTAIANLDDHSWQLTPELSYTGWQDVELRARAVLLHGGPLTEYGAKAAERRLELSLRLYF